MKNGLIREEVSLEDDNLVVFYFLSACDTLYWHDKMCDFRWEWALFHCRICSLREGMLMYY